MHQQVLVVGCRVSTVRWRASLPAAEIPSLSLWLLVAAVHVHEHVHVHVHEHEDEHFIF
jgi:hypothetical protein